MRRMRHLWGKCVLFLAGVLAVAFGVLGQEKEAQAATSVTKASQFYSAAESGNDISLAKNIVLTKPVWVKKGADLYGNGYKIQFESSSAEVDFLIFTGGTSSNPSVIDDVNIVTKDGTYCGNGIATESGCVLKMTDVIVHKFFQGISTYGNTTMVDCKIHRNGNDGWVPHGKSYTHTVKNCDFYDNGDWRDSSGYAVKFSKSDAYNQNFGTAASAMSCWGGKFTITGCDIYNNENCGIITQSDCTVSINNCEIYENGVGNDQVRSGIQIKGSSDNVTMTGGGIYDNPVDGVRVTAGTFRQESGTIYSNSSFGLRVNGGTGYLTGGTVRDNGTDGVRISSGSFSQTGGTISGNGTDGIRISAGKAVQSGGTVKNNGSDGVGVRTDDSTFVQDGGTISGNGRYGIYQNGTYKMAKAASVSVEDSKNYIYLTSGHFIHLSEKLTASGQLGKIHTASDDRQLARQVIKATSAVPDSHIASLNGRFALGFAKVVMTTGAEERNLPNAAVRAGNGVNAPANTMILSGTLTGKYKSGVKQAQIESVPGFSIDSVPEKENYYWKESYTFSGLGGRPVPYKSLRDGSGNESTFAIGGSMIFRGWTSSVGLNDEPLARALEIPAERLGDDVVFTAVWDFRFDLLFCGNGQTNAAEAPDYEIYDLAAESAMPANDGPQHNSAYLERDAGATAGYFGKAYQWTAAEQKRYDKNRESFVDYLDKYAFEGWSKRADCTYKDEDLLRPGTLLGGKFKESADVLDWFFRELAQVTEASSRTATDGKVGIRYYAVWDRFPEIDALDRYFLWSDAKAGRITEEELLKKVESADTEDGALENGTAVRLVDYSKGDLSDLGDAGSMSVRYAATDMAGNTAYYDVVVHIAGDEGSMSRIGGSSGRDRRAPIYLRFVSEEFFGLGADCKEEASAKAAYNGGALEPYSVWYQKEGYRKELERAFASLKEEKFAKNYSYGQSDIKKAQAFLRSDEAKIPDDTFREKFASEFVQTAEK